MEHLIKDYCSFSAHAIDKLRCATKQESIMRAWREGKIRKSDQINDLSYELHGAGIWIELSGQEVEIDFLPGELTGGFDSWRLFQFVRTRREIYGQISRQEIEQGLDSLLKSGVIKTVSNSLLYKLADS